MPADYPYWMQRNDTFLLMSLRWTSQAMKRLDTRDDSRPYLRLITVRDAPRLGEGAQEGHVLDELDELDLEHVRRGVSTLVLDLSNEGPAFFPGMFDALHRRLDALSIPWERVALVQQNLDLEADYRRYYNDGRITFLISDFYVKCIGAAFSERHQNVTESSAFRDIGYAPARGTAAGPVYLSLNGALRWHRVALYRFLTSSGLFDDGLVSFMGAGPDNPKKEGLNFRQPPAAVTASLPGGLGDVESWIPRQAIRFDGRPETGNDLTSVYIPEAYARTCFSIVTESDFFTRGIRRITEKTMKAACMGHPFLLLGPPGSLLILQRYGFQTFPEVFDEFYDDIEDPAERFRAVCARIERVVAGIKADRAGWLSQVSEAAIHNYEHGRRYFLDSYFNAVERRLFEQLSELLNAPAH